MANLTIQAMKEAADVADEAMRRHPDLSIFLRIHADSVRVVGRMAGRDYSNASSRGRNSKARISTCSRQTLVSS
jgi:hypothetical protein